MKLKISELTIESYERVFDLWNRCDGIGLGDSDTKENIALFLKRNPGMSCIAKMGDTLVGAVLAGHDGRRGYIYHLAVSANHRQQGIGRMLVAHCIGRLKTAGISKCHIFMFTDNAAGKKFWDAAGWSCRNDIGMLSRFID